MTKHLTNPTAEKRLIKFYQTVFHRYQHLSDFHLHELVILAFQANLYRGS